MVLIMTFLWESLTLWFRTFSVDFDEEKIIEVKKKKKQDFTLVFHKAAIWALFNF